MGLFLWDLRDWLYLTLISHPKNRLQYTKIPSVLHWKVNLDLAVKALVEF